MSAGMAGAVVAAMPGSASAYPYPALTFSGQLVSTEPPAGFQYDYSGGGTCTSYFDGGIPVAVAEFSVSEQSSVQLDAYQVVGLPECLAPDLHLRLYRFDEAGPLAANLVAQNDDCGFGCGDPNGSYAFQDPFLDLTLDRGRYLLAIGPSSLTDAEAEAGFADGSFCEPCGGFQVPVLSGSYFVEVYGDFVTDMPLADITNVT